MKRNLFALTAIVLAIGFSAFTAPKAKKTFANFYYFQISGQLSPTSAVTPAQTSSYLGLFDETNPPSGTGCSGITYQCVSGFRADQVEEISAGVYEVVDSQVPPKTPGKKSS